MQLNTVALTNAAWHGALEDGGSLMLSGATGAILLTHFTGAVEPALDAPAHYISENTLKDILVISFDPGVKVRIRAYSEPCDLKVSA